MKILKLNLLPLLFFIALGGATPDVFACSCHTPTACEAFNGSQAVFIGRPIKASKQQDRSSGGQPRIVYFGEVVFEVIEPFSGVSDRFITVWSSVDELCGGHSFIPGSVYLVYARELSDKKLWAGNCGRTRLLDTLWLDSLIYGNDGSDSYRKHMADKKKEYDEELVFLRDSAQGRINGAQIYGTVLTSVNYLKKREDRLPGYVSGATVKVEGEGQSVVLQTDDVGQYNIQGLKPGTYSVTLTPPDGYRIERENNLKQEAVIRNCGCRSLGFRLEPDTNIRGRVLDEKGNPIDGLQVNLLSADWQDEPSFDAPPKSLSVWEERSQKSGEFIFENVPVGRYLIGVSVVNSEPKFPYSRTFYPRTSDIKLAEVIKVELGKKAGPFELRLTKKLPTQTIEGVVLWPDETPVVGASVRISFPGEYKSQDEADTDDKGCFTLKALKGWDYEITVYWHDDEGVSGKTKPSPLGWENATSESERMTVTKDIKGLKFVLTKRER